jgi:N-methylhydantoinase A/oxoprolinase/acetone carboxylase beta subunit
MKYVVGVDIGGTFTDCVVMDDRAGDLKDPAFLAEAEKSKLGVDPVTGETLEKIVAGLYKMNPAILAKLKEVLD